MSTSAITRITGHDHLPAPTPARRATDTIPGQYDPQTVVDDLSDVIGQLAGMEGNVEALEETVARSRAHRMVWEAPVDDDRVTAAEATAALLGMRIVTSGEYWRADRAGVATALLTVKDGDKSSVAVLMVADTYTEDGAL
jgi:hypothetical protein